MSRLPIVLLPLFLAMPLFAQPTLAVVEKKAGKVALYTVEGKRLGEIEVGAFPHELAFSPDRRLLYVTGNGMLWMTDKGEGGNTISIIDVVSRKKAGTIDLGNYRRPHGIAVHPRTGELFVTTENPHGLLRVDPVTRKIIRKYDVGGDSPHMVRLGPGGDTAWVSVSGSGLVSVIDIASGAIQTKIETGKNPQGSVLARDGNTLYMTNSASNSISIVDVKARKVLRNIASGAGPNRIYRAPDEKTLLYSFQAGAGMGFADIASAKETTRIPLPGPPLSLSLSKDSQTAFLGIQDSDKIVVISVPQRKIIRVFDTPAGAGPDSIEPL